MKTYTTSEESSHEMPLVSVVIPVYNAEKGLSRCLDSILTQTYTNLELIFVNDASTDRSLDIIRAFVPDAERKGMTCKVISRESNHGVASARNVAFKNATGRYVYSVDADDYIDPQTVQAMVEAAIDNEADIVGIEWNLTFDKNERKVSQADAKTGWELFERLTDGVIRWNLWLFMIRRSLIEDNHLRFTEGDNMGEDMMLMIKLALLSDKVTIIHIPFYHYIQTNTGALTKNWTAESRRQVESNLREAERWTIERFGVDKFLEHFMRLKLNIKLPLLISDNIENYKIWEAWFPEANKYISSNKQIPARTKFIQIAALRRQYWILKIYYILVIKTVYGILFK